MSALVAFNELHDLCRTRGWKLGVEREEANGRAMVRIVVLAAGKASLDDYGAVPFVSFDRLEAQAARVLEVLG